MNQADKPTIAWAVVQGSYSWRPAVREIIARTPKGVWLRQLRDSWRTNPHGEMCPAAELKAEFATEAEAAAAVERSVKAYESYSDRIAQARVARREAELACVAACDEQRQAANAALTGRTI